MTITKEILALIRDFQQANNWNRPNKLLVPFDRMTELHMELRGLFVGGDGGQLFGCELDYHPGSDIQVSYKAPKPVITVVDNDSAKCPCCGSRQFVDYQSRRICTYCRSEQDGQTVQTESVLCSDGVSMYWGNAVLRPEVCVRIPEL